MLDCQTVEGYLSQRLDDELDARTRLAVDVHLRRCGACQIAYRKMDSIRSCLERRQRVSAPEDFSHELQRRLRVMEAESLLETRQTRHRLRKALWLAGSLAACLAFSVSGVIYWNASTEPPRIATHAVTAPGNTTALASAHSPLPLKRPAAASFSTLAGSSRFAPTLSSEALPAADSTAWEPGDLDGMLAQGSTSAKRSWAHVSY